MQTNRPAIVTAPPLSADEYRKRFDAAQGSMQKSLLVGLALLAFWLAIENGFARYVELQKQSADLARAQKLSARITRTLKEGVVAEPAPFQPKVEAASAASGAAPNPPAPASVPAEKRLLSSEVVRYETLLAQIATTNAERVVNIQGLKKEAVELSLVGTKLPSKISFAPTIWMMTLAFWLRSFLIRRDLAHQNLAAFYLSLPWNRRPVGVAGEGSLWLSPIPGIVRFGGGAGASSVSRTELRSSLGWTEETSFRDRVILWLLCGLGILLTLRMTAVGLAVVGNFAMSQGVSPGWWQVPGTFIVVMCSFVSIVQFIALATAPSQARGLPESFSTVRRTAIGVGSAAVLAFAATALRPAKTKVPANKKLFFIDAYDRLIVSSPRFRSKEYKARRQANRNHTYTVGKANAVVVGKRSLQRIGTDPSQATLHFSDAKQVVRLESKPRVEPELSVVEPSTAMGWLDKPPKGKAPKLVGAANTLVWERWALAMIEAKRVKEATDLLLKVAQMQLSHAPSGRLNLRVIDLAAGLALRAGDDSLRTIVGGVRTRMEKSRLAYAGAQSPKASSKVASNRFERTPAEREELALIQRVGKWSAENSRWRKRWLSKERAVAWHHPTETRPYHWTRKTKFVREPSNPEPRQRPILLAKA